MALLTQGLKSSRHKPRSLNENKEAEGEKITIWVSLEEKIICGLTKHTTCVDVVQAAIKDQQNIMDNSHTLLGNSVEYCIVEEWRGFQYILPSFTQMLRRWKAWGEEQVNINFFLIKLKPTQPCLIRKTANKHVEQHHHSAASVVKSFPLHKQKRIVRKTFRKLAKMKKDIDNAENHEVQKLMQIIASQDSIIKQQTNKMQELDKLIEEYEADLQLGTEDEDEHSAQCCYLKEDKSRPQRCKSLLDNDDLNKVPYIKAETNTCHIYPETSSKEFFQGTSSFTINHYLDLHVAGGVDFEVYMLSSIKKAIDENLKVGINLHSFYIFLQKEIHHCNSLQQAQKRQYEILKQELKSLNESDNQLCFKSLEPHDENSEGLGNITPDLSIIQIQSDTESDTGISSTHSQDSDPTA